MPLWVTLLLVLLLPLLAGATPLAVAAGVYLHRDSDEADLSQPIVTASLGESATFLWGKHDGATPCGGWPFTTTMCWSVTGRRRWSTMASCR